MKNWLIALTLLFMGCECTKPMERDELKNLNGKLDSLTLELKKQRTENIKLTDELEYIKHQWSNCESRVLKLREHNDSLSREMKKDSTQK